MGDEISRDVLYRGRLAGAMARGAAERASHGRISAVGEGCGLEVAPWFAVACEPRGEWVAVAGLRAAGLPVFLPHVAETRAHRGRRIGVMVALFPGYLFARMRRGEIEAVRVLDGVGDVVRQAGVALAVPEAVVARLMAACDDNGCVRRAAGKGAREAVAFAVGELVRIGAGPFVGYQGVVADVDSGGRIGLDVGVFGRATRVVGTGDDLDLESVAPAKPRRRHPVPGVSRPPR